MIIDSKGFITDPYKNFIHISRYARWLDASNRRETWVESVRRYMAFMVKHLVANHGYKNDDPVFAEIEAAIVNHELMPSMRALMAAGPAMENDNISAYNCSFIAVDSLRSFDEAMYILMNGTGVGFSVEQKFINSLPVIAEDFFSTETTIVVEDSKLGWAKAYKELIALLSQGQVPNWDTHKVRPAGARLKTFGGRASGPEPLRDLFRFTTQVFRNARGRKLKPIEAHDIMCKIGEVVVVGGVRRSALISLSNLDDFEMAKAKSGQWWETQGQRSLANNSAVYDRKPTTAQFLREWRNLYDSKSGERGIFNMDAVRKHIDKAGRRDSSKVHGTNPCAEILLRPNEFCNLTEVVIGAEDTKDKLLNKVRLATLLGTWQSSLTNFKYIRKSWKTNCEEERLLGVSLTGIYGNPLTSTNGPDLKQLLEDLKAHAINVNISEAANLGIPTSAAITSTSYTDTNITATITPTSATSKVLVLITANTYNDSGGSRTAIGAGAQIVRGATSIYSQNLSPFRDVFVLAILQNQILDCSLAMIHHESHYTIFAIRHWYNQMILDNLPYLKVLAIKILVRLHGLTGKNLVHLSPANV